MQIGAGTLHRVASCQEDNQGGDQLTNPFLSLKIFTFQIMHFSLILHFSPQGGWIVCLSSVPSRLLVLNIFWYFPLMSGPQNIWILQTKYLAIPSRIWKYAVQNVELRTDRAWHLSVLMAVWRTSPLRHTAACTYLPTLKCNPKIQKYTHSKHQITWLWCAGQSVFWLSKINSKMESISLKIQKASKGCFEPIRGVLGPILCKQGGRRLGECYSS